MSRLRPRRAARSRARRLVRSRLGDHVIALSAASVALPVVGKRLEPLSGFAALGAGGHRYVGGIVAGMTRSRLRRDRSEYQRVQRAATPQILTEALRDVVDTTDLTRPWPDGRRLTPFLKAAGQRRRYVYRSSVSYGDEPEQLLDVWRCADSSQRDAPVLLFIPGGAWVFGRRELQGHALMSHLVRRGWVCFSMQYRSSPRHRWPRQIIDVKTAIAWARANAGDFGGDPNFVAVVGCSAGGHLATLAGLTADETQWQADPDADASVDAVVSMYGIYDWHTRATNERDRFIEFLERVVVKRSQARHPEIYRAASPIERVHSLAPPFMAVHGASDGLIPVAEARAFVDELRAVSQSSVSYAELPGVGHGFDLIDSRRTGPVVAAIGRFLTHVHQQYGQRQADSAV